MDNTKKTLEELLGEFFDNAKPLSMEFRRLLLRAGQCDNTMNNTKGVIGRPLQCLSEILEIGMAKADVEAGKGIDMTVDFTIKTDNDKYKVNVCALDKELSGKILTMLLELRKEKMLSILYFGKSKKEELDDLISSLFDFLMILPKENETTSKQSKEE
ncbi:hypothetical protein [Bacteroides clarus]|uniref:hypothetical protein n=1 Tax=Bacteroides clarus TaxID=626929 RepID=UPI0011DE3F6C|nr:hypothetical protein [Bacteroides clarus]